jgi:hypothetical protein
MAMMAKVESMADSMAEIKAIVQQRQHYEHQKFMGKELIMYCTTASATQVCKPPSKPNLIKGITCTLMPSLAKLSSTPSCLQFSPTHGLEGAIRGRWV